MLARGRRLRLLREIARVYGRGRYGGAEGVQVKALATGRPDCRLATVVSKKISKKATVRNRIRRRIAAEMAARWETLAPGYDIVVSVRADISAITSDDLRQRLQLALTKAGVIIV